MPCMVLPALPRRLALGFILLSPLLAAAAEIIRPKVVIVAMFEICADTGDKPGEFQFWVEREKLDRVVPLPAGHRFPIARAIVDLKPGENPDTEVLINLR